MSKESPGTKPIKLAAPTSTLEAVVKICGVIIVALGVFFFGQLLPVLLIVTILGFTGRDLDAITDLLENNVAWQLVVIASIAIFTTAIIWKLLQWRGHSPRRFLMLDRLPTWKQVGEVVLTYGVYFMVLITATVIVGILTPVNIDQSQELGVADTAGSGLLAVFVMLAVIPPIFEEILFRGFLFQYLAGFGGIAAGYVLTSLIFGAAHLEYDNLNWIAAIDTLIFSGFLIYISQKHQSLYSAIIMHAIKNGIAFFALFVI